MRGDNGVKAVRYESECNCNRFVIDNHRIVIALFYEQIAPNIMYMQVKNAIETLFNLNNIQYLIDRAQCLIKHVIK